MCSRFKLSKNKPALPGVFWKCHRFAESHKVGSSFELHVNVLLVALYFSIHSQQFIKPGKQS